jgi:hypothetical protein
MSWASSARVIRLPERGRGRARWRARARSLGAEAAEYPPDQGPRLPPEQIGRRAGQFRHQVTGGHVSQAIPEGKGLRGRDRVRPAGFDEPTAWEGGGDQVEKGIGRRDPDSRAGARNTSVSRVH